MTSAGCKPTPAYQKSYCDIRLLSPTRSEESAVWAFSLLDTAQPNSVSEAEAEAHLAAAERMHALEAKTKWVSTIRATFDQSELLSAMITRIQYRNDPTVCQHIELLSGSPMEKMQSCRAESVPSLMKKYTQ
jgi:hypothetical protein